MEIVGKLDDWGRGAWIATMIGGFLLFPPLGFVILAYVLFTGRMSTMHYYDDATRQEWREKKEAVRNEWRARKEEWRDMKRSWKAEMRKQWHAEGGCGHRNRHAHNMHQSSGNAAFDAYREETLRRLEDEQAEFTEFLDNLRKARDKAEFDQFMDSRRKSDASDVIVTPPPSDTTERRDHE